MVTAIETPEVEQDVRRERPPRTVSFQNSSTALVLAWRLLQRGRMMLQQWRGITIIDQVSEQSDGQTMIRRKA